MNLRNILVLAEGQLGDLLLLTPALRGLKSNFASASLSVLVVDRRRNVRNIAPSASIQGPLGRDADSPLATNPHVDALYVLSRPFLRSLHGLQRLRAELRILQFLRSRKFDAVICTFPEDRFAAWAFGSGASVRVGQKDQGLSWLLTHTPSIRKDENGVLRYYCDLVRAIGGNPSTDRTEYAIPPISVRAAEEFLKVHGLGTSRKLIAVHPGASGDYKIWPPERFAELITKLQERWGATVLLCFGDQDGAVVADLKRYLSASVVEVNTGDGLGRLAGLLSRCLLCISNDSGPRHLAIAVGTPSLAIFRQHHDREWQVYPESATCGTIKGVETCPVCPQSACLDKIPAGERFGSHCIRSISVDAVLDRIAPLLQ